MSTLHTISKSPKSQLLSECLMLASDGDGILFIEVPNIETKDASPHNIYFKAHIHYFSASTLTSAASNYFEKIDEDIGSNLRIIFKRKDVVEDNLTFPT